MAEARAARRWFAASNQVAVAHAKRKPGYWKKR